MPQGAFVPVGVYVDDFPVAYVCKLLDLMSACGADEDTIDNANAKLDLHNVPRSDDKGFGLSKAHIKNGK